MTGNYRRWSGRVWRFSSISQIPTAGIRQFVAGMRPSPIPKVPVIIQAIFVNDNGTLTTTDDQYCQVIANDTFKLDDKRDPIIYPLTIETADLNFNASHLKRFFTSTELLDNCSPLTTLQDNLEIRQDPRRLSMVDLVCNVGRNTYFVDVRTLDAFGNPSRYVNCKIVFTEKNDPIVSATGPSRTLGLNDTCKFTLKTSHIAVTATDDWTPRANLTLSYLIVSFSL